MHQEKALNNPILDGVIWKQLLAFFFPILFGTFFQQLYNTADAVIVGRYVGKEALAAVGGATGTLINLVVNLFVGISSGATVVVAQHYGSNNQDGMHKAVHSTVMLALIGGAAFTVLGLAASYPALVAMGTNSEVMPHAIVYLRVYFLGIIPSFLYNVGAGILRAIGDSRRPLYFLMTACMINIVLDLLFVAVFHMGTFGAAFATIISQFVSAILVLICLTKGDEPVQLKWKDVRFYKSSLKKVLFVGIPAGLQSNMYTISNILIQASINSFGTDTMAAWTAFGKLDNFFWMISGAFGLSVTTFAGQNFGAGRIDRVKTSAKLCLCFTSASAVLISALFYAFGGQLLRIFNDDPAVIETGLVMIKYMVPFYITFVCVEVFSATIRGCGNAVRPAVLTGCGICLLRVLWVIFLLPVRNELTTILISYPVSWMFTSILFVIYYFRGSWQRHGPAVDSEAPLKN